MTNYERIAFTVPIRLAGLKEQLTKEASAEGRTLSNYIVRILENRRYALLPERLRQEGGK